MVKNKREKWGICRCGRVEWIRSGRGACVCAALWALKTTVDQDGLGVVVKGFLCRTIGPIVCLASDKTRLTRANEVGKVGELFASGPLIRLEAIWSRHLTALSLVSSPQFKAPDPTKVNLKGIFFSFFPPHSTPLVQFLLVCYRAQK